MIGQIGNFKAIFIHDKHTLAAQDVGDHARPFFIQERNFISDLKFHKYFAKIFKNTIFVVKLLKMKKLYFIFLIFICCCKQDHPMPDPVVSAFKTKNVFIVVMDGARYSETWGEPNR